MSAAAHVKLVSPAVGSSSWMWKAACRGQDPEIYDEAFTKKVSPDVRCFLCTVRPQCFTYAVENRYDGTWGGTTKYERKHMVERRRLRTQCPKPGCLGRRIRNAEGYGTCLSCGLRWNIPVPRS